MSPDRGWESLKNFFSVVDPGRCAFLSLNWDVVIETGLRHAQSIKSYDYRCGALGYDWDKKSKRLVGIEPGKNDPTIMKPHGSANWMYCDCCRQVFWMPAKQTLWIASQIFSSKDWKVVEDVTKKSYDHQSKPCACPICGAKALGTRFATFSYRKALGFSMHERSWDAAEQVLRRAETWTFIGYSLPAADYEFKMLLKRVQLSRKPRPQIVLVTGGDSAGSTKATYTRFFGPRISKTFTNGIDEAVIEELGAMGALRNG